MYMNIIYDTEYSTASSSMVRQFSIIVVYDNLNNPLLETVSILPWPLKKKKKGCDNTCLKLLLLYQL